MEHSGFFNALQQNGVYDRHHNADDYSDNLAVVIGNGILRDSENACRVTANGRVVSVDIGRAWINGRHYYNDSIFHLIEVPQAVGGNRIDRVVLRLNNNLGTFGTTTERTIRAVYVQGEASTNPTAPAPVRTSDIYDIVLADVNVTAGQSAITVIDKRGVVGLCDWIYSNNRGYLFKDYTWEMTLLGTTSTVQFNIPQYNAETTILEVYVNGILENEGSDYTISGNIISFDGSLVAGTVVTVKCYKSVEVSQVASVVDDVTELQNKVASIDGLSKFAYVCTGIDDNIALSQIAQALYSGTYSSASVNPSARAFLESIGGIQFLSALTAEAQVTIDVVGRLTASTPYAGAGSSASRYRWFDLGISTESTKRIVFDFSHCEKVTIGCNASTNNIIFYGNDMRIVRANVYAYSNGNGCTITMFEGAHDNGILEVDASLLSISTTGNGLIALNGTFTNCECYVRSSGGEAVCFAPQGNGGLVRIEGGKFRAYVSSGSSSLCTVFNVAASQPSAKLFASNIRCPVVAMAGYKQNSYGVFSAGQSFIFGILTDLQKVGDKVTVWGAAWEN